MSDGIGGVGGGPAGAPAKTVPKKRTEAIFNDLTDSPMFMEQANILEGDADRLKERIGKFLKGAKKYRDSLDTASLAQQAFCKCMREFCGDVTDEDSLALGAGVLIRYISAFNEISSFYDLLRSQVNLLIIDQLQEVLLDPMNAVRDGKKRVDRSLGEYEASKRKFLSLPKTVEDSLVLQAEKDLRHAKNTYDADRFGLARSLLSIHHTKKSFFVETTSEMVDAHMKFFKQGFDLIRVMEPYIHESLEQAQDRKGRATEDMDAFDESIAIFLEQQQAGSVNGGEGGAESVVGSTSGAGDEAGNGGGAPPRHHHQRSLSHSSVGSLTSTNPIGLSSPSHTGGGPVQMSSQHSQLAQEIEASMRLHLQKGDVVILKQGYLLKRSSNIRGDWKSRFFVLDSKGSLYYYSKQQTKGKDMGTPHETVELLTSTVKMDADSGDDKLRFCFRVVSPMRTYTLQAESEQDRSAWVVAIQCVIASLLNGIERSAHQGPGGGAGSDSSGLGRALSTHSVYTDAGSSNSPMGAGGAGSDALSERYLSARSFHLGEDDLDESDKNLATLELIRSIPGNDRCADCGAPMPDWASLNLTVTLCIECSGTHRKLGVHISKVRSITLDDNAWEGGILDIFKMGGNDFVNSVLEKRLQMEEKGKKGDEWLWNAEDDEAVDSPDLSRARAMSVERIRKPHPNDPLLTKEVFIRKKYVDRSWVVGSGSTEALLKSVASSDIRGILESLLTGASASSPCAAFASILEAREKQAHVAAMAIQGKAVIPKELAMRMEGDVGITALHIMSDFKDVNVLDLLTLYSSDINARDAYGRTPLMYCILARWEEGAKLLLKRGAARGTTDVYDLTALEMAMAGGCLTNELAELLCN